MIWPDVGILGFLRVLFNFCLVIWYIHNNDEVASNTQFQDPRFELVAGF